jgi:hypothetical protein
MHVPVFMGEGGTIAILAALVIGQLKGGADARFASR